MSTPSRSTAGSSLVSSRFPVKIPRQRGDIGKIEIAVLDVDRDPFRAAAVRHLQAERAQEGKPQLAPAGRIARTQLVIARSAAGMPSPPAPPPREAASRSLTSQPTPAGWLAHVRIPKEKARPAPEIQVTYPADLADATDGDASLAPPCFA